VATNDTLQLSVIGFVANQQHVHTLHFRHILPNMTDLELAEDYRDNVLPSYRAMFNTTDTPAEVIRVQQVCGSLPLRAAAEVAPPNILGTYDANGASIGDWMAPWLASYATVKTALGGRSRQGRFYLGGLNEAWVNGAALNTLAQGSGRTQRQATYITALGRYITAGAWTANSIMVVHSHKLASVANTQCQNSSTPVTSIINRTVLATMKSRKAGHGR
jgi:hypothetical protein